MAKYCKMPGGDCCFRGYRGKCERANPCGWVPDDTGIVPEIARRMGYVRVSLPTGEPGHYKTGPYMPIEYTRKDGYTYHPKEA